MTSVIARDHGCLRPPVRQGTQVRHELEQSGRYDRGGWEVSGLGTFSTGMPLQVTQSGGTIWDGTQRPDLIGDPSTSGTIQIASNNCFNPRGIQTARAGQFGQRPSQPELPWTRHEHARCGAAEELARHAKDSGSSSAWKRRTP